MIKEILLAACCLWLDCNPSPAVCAVVLLLKEGGMKITELKFYYKASEPYQTSPGAFCFFSQCLPKKEKVKEHKT